jgi:FG-GAP-like repeat
MRHPSASIVPSFPFVERVEARCLLSTTAAVMPTLASGDFNGDGSAESLVWVNAGRARLAGLGFSGASLRRGSLVFVDDVGGVFGSPLSLRARGNRAPLVAAGDFNSDSRLDLVVGGRRVSGARRGLTFLAGNGDGTFATGVPIPGAPPTVTSLIAGDVNGDGRLDLIGTARGNRQNAAADDSIIQVPLNSDSNGDQRMSVVNLPADDGSGRAHRSGATAEAGGGYAQFGFVAVGNDTSAPPGVTPPAARVGATAETGGARAGRFEDLFDGGLIGHEFEDDQVFVLLGGGDGTFTAAGDADAD